MTQEEIRQIADAVSVEIASRREMTFLEGLEIIRIQAIFEGMRVENYKCRIDGNALAYDEAAFDDFSRQIISIQEKYIEELKRQHTRRKRGVQK